ncbi:hypothetical protein RHMOL_Rhmol09G0116800 [Rhododendron molle]|uniref:Uncharacterized protein n=1 Tax=Rhododendron molle TaxID=49168 RepID=A0ACC0ME04_RHOML|nr:hypothetical protein RHMOL_Rhmol09G0116800 [Rhododendron molle]
MGIIPEAPLGSSNAMIPMIGFGTALWPLGGSETMKQSVLQAIELGYRHFDTAAIYQSEQCLGEAIAQVLHLGLVRSMGRAGCSLGCTAQCTQCVGPNLLKGKELKSIIWAVSYGSLFQMLES